MRYDVDTVRDDIVYDMMHLGMGASVHAPVIVVGIQKPALSGGVREEL